MFKGRSKLIVGILAVLMLVGFMLVGCEEPEEVVEEEPEEEVVEEDPVEDEPAEDVEDADLRYALGTASVGGVYYVYGGGVAEVLTSHVDYLAVSAEVTGGPQVNIGLVQTGDNELGLTTDAPAYEAYGGFGWADQEYSDIRGLVAMYPSGLQVFSIEGAGVESFADIEGAVLGLGPSGGTVDVVGRNILDALDIEPAQIQNLGWSETVGNMKDGMIDVAMDMGGWPHPSREELQATHEIVWLTLTDEEREMIQDEYYYYLDGTIPGGTYETMVDDYDTLFIWNCVFGHKDIPEDVAYDITKTLYENQDELKAVHSAAEDTLPENISEINIPLHPGSIRYHEEVGIDLLDHHYPPEY